MSRELKTLVRPNAAALLELAATANPAMPPAVMPVTGSEIVNLRLSIALIDELDAVAEAEGTTRKVIITRALAAAGYRVPTHDLEDRTPRKRRRRAASATTTPTS
jgi:predicted transcriptional regulator